MPNWCSNALGVTGPAEDISKFVESIKELDESSESEWDICRPYPLPKVLEGTRAPRPTMEQVDRLRNLDPEVQPILARNWTQDAEIQDLLDKIAQADKAEKETGYADWYTWTNAHWGTKWSPDVTQASIELTAVSLTFDSAWSPPQGLVVELSRINPALTFILEYAEPGTGYLGASAYRKGEEVVMSYINCVEDDDPLMKSLNDAIRAVYKAEEMGEEFNPNLEGDLQDRINERWMQLQERAGADVAEALTV